MAQVNGKKPKKEPAVLSLCLVPCRVEPGMFREEFLVYLDALDPHNPKHTLRAQLLVDQSVVADIHGTPRRNNPVPAWLRVTFIEKQGEWASVVLPQPSQPLGESVLVPAARIKKAPGP